MTEKDFNNCLIIKETKIWFKNLSLFVYFKTTFFNVLCDNNYYKYNPYPRNMEEKPKPYYEKDRPPCPFYGFNGMYGGFFDTDGNQCGLITDSHAPCRMEQEGDTPDWNGCIFYNTEENRAALEKISGNIKVFPKEFAPPKSSWRGIILETWFEYLGIKID